MTSDLLERFAIFGKAFVGKVRNALAVAKEGGEVGGVKRRERREYVGCWEGGREEGVLILTGHFLLIWMEFWGKRGRKRSPTCRLGRQPTQSCTEK